jgi:hypothetical protein
VKPDTPIPEGTNTIYSSFGSGYSYYCCNGYNESGPTSAVTPQIVAYPFTPTKGTYLLTRLDLAISYISGRNGYTLELDADDHGQPGRRIAKWEVTGSPTLGTSSNSVETIKVRELIILSKGHQYWLVPIVKSAEYAVWNWTSAGGSGYLAWSLDGGSTWLTGNYYNGAFDVLGLKLF